MKIFNFFVDRALSSSMVLLYIFISLLYSNGLLIVLSPIDKLYVLGTVVFCNIIPFILIKKLFAASKILFYLATAFFLILSAYIISHYIFYLYVSMVYISVLWIMSSKEVYKQISYQIASLAAAATFLYFIFLTQLVSIIIAFIVFVILLGVVATVRMYRGSCSGKEVVISVLVGVASVVFSILFLSK